jgi:hypothetical protein
VLQWRNQLRQPQDETRAQISTHVAFHIIDYFA